MPWTAPALPSRLSFLDCAGASRLRRHPRTRAARAAPAHRLAAPRRGRGAHPARRRRRATRQAAAVTGRPSWPSTAASRCCGRRGPTPPSSSPNSPNWRPTAVRWWPTARCCATACWPCPPHGWVNLHFSLLPAWRGAAPVQAAHRRGRHGDRRHDLPDRTQPGLRAGLRRRHRADPADRHRGRLLSRLAVSGAALLEATLDGIADGSLTPVPQPADGVTSHPKITVDDARVRWDLPAPRRRPAHPRGHAQSRRLDDDRRPAGQGRPGRPSTTRETRRCAAPGAIRVDRT